MRRRRLGWVPRAWQRWASGIGVLFTLVGIVALVVSHSREWAWLAIAGLFSLVVALAWTAHDEYNGRLKAEEREKTQAERHAAELERKEREHAQLAQVLQSRLSQAGPSRGGLFDMMHEQELARSRLAPDLARKEDERQHRLVTRFAKRYVREHPDADPGIAEGTVPIPKKWLEEQLKAIDENWVPESYLADPE